ncbi:hypothetical protein [Sanguibacter antarcticus]|uniref:VWA domain-containing protein n=1 Tax=Sanguibacter antarcticus TaxID=372484 RepID=A0A2A9E8L3_9MICO|nr:hypothetical protein [Sanguibacter antarcticus]PFG35224.1 hypothetical protein ATL42_3163 [Sanguibacter antarcticus]
MNRRWGKSAQARAATSEEIVELRARWQARWPDALHAWGASTRLHAPSLRGPESGPSDVGSFAWFSLGDVEVSIDLGQVLERGLGEHAVAVLAHEIGHHVCSPGDLLTAGRLAAQVRLGLVDLDEHVALVSNLWSDLLVNDRLQVRAGVDLAAVWRTLGPPLPTDHVMRLVLRTDEILWALPAGSLAGPGPHHEAEAGLLARVARAYADDPVGGAGGFAMVLRPLLVRDEPTGGGSRWCDQHEQPGTAVPGLADDQSAVEAPVHPALDRRVVGAMADLPPTADDATPDSSLDSSDADASTSSRPSAGSTLSPADYAAVLRSLGTTTDPREAAAQWYREHARKHLVPFPVRTVRRSQEPLLAGYDVWDVGDDLADLDWTATMLASPIVLPGLTTVQRRYDTDDGGDPQRVPVDLDLYLDSSGSMPDPAASGAPIALAGAILALSALRSGARVQATTWSGPQQVAGTGGFTRDADAVLRAIVAHFGGGTSFPVQVLAQTHLGDGRRPVGGGLGAARRARHIAVISDDGVTTMFTDGQWFLPEGFDPRTTVAARAVEAAGGGGTLVLNTSSVERYVAMAPGYDVHGVTDAQSLVTFARDFARRLWGQDRRSGQETHG